MVRHFYLQRNEDYSGVSGTGVVAIGAVNGFTGETVMWWLGEKASTVLYSDIEHVEQIHGHGGRTHIVWGDPPREAVSKHAYQPAEGQNGPTYLCYDEQCANEFPHPIGARHE